MRGAAAIVAASVYEEEVRAEDAAFEASGMIGAESHAEVTCYLPPLPGYRGALAAHVEMVRRATESVAVPLIASLNGSTREGWTGIAADLEEAGAAALELNLFHIPSDPQETSTTVEGRMVETVREVCATVTIPVAVKLSPNFTAPAHLASPLADAGASGLVLFGRCYEPDIDLETLRFRPSLRRGYGQRGNIGRTPMTGSPACHLVPVPDRARSTSAARQAPRDHPPDARDLDPDRVMGDHVAAPVSGLTSFERPS